MSTKKAGKNLTRSFKIINPEKIKIACVISEWHSEITENLFIGVKKKLMMHGLIEKNIPIGNKIIKNGKVILNNNDPMFVIPPPTNFSRNDNIPLSSIY